MTLLDFTAKPGKLSFKIMALKVIIPNAQTKTWEVLAHTPDYICEILQTLWKTQTVEILTPESNAAPEEVRQIAVFLHYNIMFFKTVTGSGGTLW